MDAIGIVSLGRLGIVDGEYQIPRQSQHQEKFRRPVQPPGSAGFLLHQNGDVLIEKKHRQHHGTDKRPVELGIEKGRHRIQMIHGMDRGGVK